MVLLFCAQAPTITKLAFLPCCLVQHVGMLLHAGLQPNETYTFAVAAYDPEHNLISELGQSAGPVAALLPLPLLHVWSQLALTAAQLGVLKLTHLAAGIVLPHFIITQPDCPVWEANPLDRQTVNRSASPGNCFSWHQLFSRKHNSALVMSCVKPSLFAWAS